MEAVAFPLPSFLFLFPMRSILFIFFISLLNFKLPAQIAEPGKTLPPWQPGFLDLHHINTGRGSAAFFIFPDGTNMLFDAGEIPPIDPRVYTARNSQIKPDSSKKPYEWICWYIRRILPSSAILKIDYALTSHFHDDHFGAWYPDAPLSSNGNYVLSGITGVGEIIPINVLADRASPDFDFPFDFKTEKKDKRVEINFDKSFENYESFIVAKKKQGMKLEKFRAGSRTQFVQKNAKLAAPDFFVQNVKSNGWIWTGKDSIVQNHFPGVIKADPATWPDENSLSLAITISYGAFKYYNGGDNPGNLIAGDNPLRDTESAIATAIGEVDIATMDHHGNRDAINETMVRNLKPRIWIGQSWSADHPGHEVLIRMTSKYLYDGPRDLFATNMLEANRIVIGSLIDRSYKSQQGHIVVRVMPGGANYYIIILDDSSPEMPVKSVFGPYQSKSGHKSSVKNN